jgi:hypothetical protein
MLLAAAYQLGKRCKKALYAYTTHIHVLPGHEGCKAQESSMYRSDQGTINRTR